MTWSKTLGAACLPVWRAAPGGLVLRVVLMAAAAMIPLAAAWLTKTVLDRLATPQAGPLAVPVALLAGCGVAGALLPHVQRYVEAEADRRTDLLLRTRLFAALGRQAGLARLEDPRFHDRLAIATGAGQSGPAAVVSRLLGMAQGLIVLIGFVATLAVLSPVLTAVVALAALPALRAELMLGRGRSRLTWELSEASRRELFYGELLSDPAAGKEIRLFGLGGLFGRRMRHELRAINERQRGQDRRELRVQSGLVGLSAVVAGGGLVWAVLAARSGQLTIGDVSVLIAAVAGVQSGSRALLQNAGQMHESLLVFEHYRAVAEAEPDLPVASPALPVPPLTAGIEFRDVWFRYGDEHPWILRGADFTLAAGAATALVGLNGAGKSTVVKLLCRLYDPTKGAILWDGIDLRSFDVAELRDRIGGVFQDFMRYELSLAENVGVGDVAAIEDRARVEAAARDAGAGAIAGGLPDGYDTALTRMFTGGGMGPGVVLSGGQWQRVAVARGLMRRERELLILDEPSSGLDALAEQEIHERLRELRGGRTSVLISHRLSAVRHADSIVVIAGGVAAERGTHESLMGLNGAYARLFTLQAKGYRA